MCIRDSLGSGLMAKLIYTLVKVEVDGRPVAVQAIVYRGAFASWLPPRDASLAFAICFVLFWYGVLRVMQRRGIVFKV